MHRTWLAMAGAGLLGISLLGFAACADDGPSNEGAADGGGDAFDAAIPGDPTGACEAWVDSLCAREAACAERSEPDPVCLARKHACPDLAFAAGSTRTVETISACIRGIRVLGCADLAAGRSPEACLPAGKLAKGAPCLYASQCNSLTCLAEDPGSCGKCAGRIKPGEDCTSAAGDLVCPPNEQCDAIGRSCQPVRGDTFAQVGDFCSGDVKDPVTCVKAEGVQCLAGARGAVDGTCGKLPGPGARCAWSPNQPRPTCAATAYCRVDANGEGGDCLALPTRDQACGGLPGAKTAVPCTGSTCRTPDGGVIGTCFPLVEQDGACTSASDCNEATYCEITSSAPTRGTCKARPAPGEPCEDKPVPGSSGATFAVPCAGHAHCTPGASGARVCFAEPAPGNVGADCAPPKTTCSALLRCVKGKCARQDPAACK